MTMQLLRKLMGMFGLDDDKNKRRISIEPADESLETVEYMVSEGKHIPVVEGDFVQKVITSWMATQRRMIFIHHGC